MVDYGYDDVEKWIDFLIDIEAGMLVLTGQEWMVEELSTGRREKYNRISKKDTYNKKRIVRASEIFEEHDEHIYREPSIGEELAVEVIRETERLTLAIDNILSNLKNWIVSEIKKEDYEVIRVELKPLDVSPYCQDKFEKCTKTLMMSATTLDKDAFCTSLGLAP